MGLPAGAALLGSLAHALSQTADLGNSNDTFIGHNSCVAAT